MYELFFSRHIAHEFDVMVNNVNKCVPILSLDDKKRSLSNNTHIIQMYIHDKV